MKKKYKVGSLFAGVGGICLGFKQAFSENSSFEMLWANEIDEYACETYRQNFEHNLIEGDINLVLHPESFDEEIDKIENEIKKCTDDLQKKTYESKLLDLNEKKKYYIQQKEKLLESQIDILTGGFPCQAFSIAGERRGFEDERGNLFCSIISLIEQLGKRHSKPRILLLENVKNLRSHDNGRTYQIIKGELEKLGYVIEEAVLNTMDYSDLPQNRERIYIVGFLHKEDAQEFSLFARLNEYKNNKTPKDRREDVKKIINYYTSIEKDYKYYYTKEKYPGYYISEEEYTELPMDKRKAVRVNLDEQIDEMYQFYQVRRGMYVRKNQSNVCPTLTANMGTGGHNVALVKVYDGIRKLTPAETFKLQGFPINKGYSLPSTYKGRPYTDSQLYKQAGNAVSVPVIRMIAEELLRVLESRMDIPLNKEVLEG